MILPSAGAPSLTYSVGLPRPQFSLVSSSALVIPILAECRYGGILGNKLTKWVDRGVEPRAARAHQALRFRSDGRSSGSGSEPCQSYVTPACCRNSVHSVSAAPSGVRCSSPRPYEPWKTAHHFAEAAVRGDRQDRSHGQRRDRPSSQPTPCHNRRSRGNKGAVECRLADCGRCVCFRARNWMKNGNRPTMIISPFGNVSSTSSAFTKRMGSPGKPFALCA